MKKILIFGALIGIAITSYATEPLDSVYEVMMKKKNLETTEVKYSGGFSNEVRGFIFQRNVGNGWTQGKRLKVKGVSPREAESVRRVFEASAPEVGHVVKVDLQRACVDEKKKTGYAVDYDPEQKTLYLLRVEIEDEPCIPKDWTTRDYYYHFIPTPKSVNWSAALARLYSEVKYNSAFVDRFATRLDSVYYSSLEELKGADDYESYRILQKTIASCEDAHTDIYADWGLFELPGSSPFTTVLIGDRLFVSSVECEKLENAGMERGMEIIAVNGESPFDYAERELSPFVCANTPQWKNHRMFDDYGFSSGRNGSDLNLTLKSSDGQKIIQVPHKINEGQWQPEKAVRHDKSFRMTEGGIGILTIPSFAYQDVTTFFDSIYPRILESKALIIDVRGNGGGNSGYADYILRHLSDDEIACPIWRTPIYKPAFASWGRDPEWYESEPEKMKPINDRQCYLGPVAVLTDRGTFSAAEDFCSIFKCMKRGPIIGTPTGGSTGNGVRKTLTKGVYVNVCSKHDKMPDGTEFVGVGIIPDIIIEETPESYFSDNKDIVLEKAIETLSSKK